MVEFSHVANACFFNIHGAKKITIFFQLSSINSHSNFFQLFPLISIATINSFVNIFSSGAFIFVG